MWRRLKTVVDASERFLRFEELQSSSDLIKARAVYLVGLVFALTQVPNVILMTWTYGEWTLDHTISVVTVAITILVTLSLRWYKVFSSYAMLYSLMIFTAIAMSAIPDGTGIHSSLLLILIAGILLNGFISGWRWVLIYSGMSMLLVTLLYINTVNGPGIDPASWPVRSQQRAIQAGLAIMLVSAIVCLFTINLHRLFTELEERIERTRKAEAAKTLFLANMSHELRTPLNGVIGMTQLLLRTNMDAQQRQYAEIVNGCSKGLVAIIDDVLDISKLDAGKLQFNNAPFNLVAMLWELLDLHRPSAAAKGLVLHLDHDPNIPQHYISDESRLRQVVNNLLGNAIKFTSRGYVSIHLRAKPIGNGRLHVEFHVRDTGIGIPSADQARIFERFEQVDNTSTTSTKGTGLGLSISRDLVRAFGGDLRLNSVEGQGTVFSFALPLLQHTQAVPYTPPAAARISRAG